MSFSYSDKDLRKLERAISPERLTPYLIRARGDSWVAIHLYVRNTELSEALYGVIQGYEVFLRNATHSKLSTGFGREYWWEVAPLRDQERGDISDAVRSLENRIVPVTSGRIVAELNLGFWTNLYANFYEHELWVSHLRGLFPIGMQRKRLHDRLNALKILRNRIAHHESLIRRNVQQDYADLLETAGWMSPTILAWIKSTNCFAKRLPKCLEKTNSE